MTKAFALIFASGCTTVFGLVPPVWEAMHDRVSRELLAASAERAALVEITRIARKAEDDLAAAAPGAVAMIYHTAATLLRGPARTNGSLQISYREMASQQRRFLAYLPLPERLWRVRDIPLPLDAILEVKIPTDGRIGKRSELELLLELWRSLEEERIATQVVDSESRPIRPLLPHGSGTAATNSSGASLMAAKGNGLYPEAIQNPLEQERYRTELEDYRAASQRLLYRARLKNEGSSFTNRVIERIVTDYHKQPGLLEQLQIELDGYLAPVISTNVISSVFAAMKPEVAAKTPRPVPGAKGERWLRPAAAPTGLVTPAVARPNRVVDAMRKQQAAQAAQVAGAASAAQAESPAGMVAAAGGTPVWAWLGLGLVALAGGWVWVRGRS